MTQDQKFEAATLLAQVMGGRSPNRLRKAEKLLAAYDGLWKLCLAPIPELVVRGLTEAQAEKVAVYGKLVVLTGTTSGIRPKETIRTAQEVYEHFRARWAGLEREVFSIILLDAKNRIIREEDVSMGSLTSSIVHPREVFSFAIRERADALVFAHNHPSGDPNPSLEDLEITRRLVEVGHLVGIRVLDHIVIGADAYVSFNERGLLDSI